MNNKIKRNKLQGTLFDNIRNLLQDARKSVVQTINSKMVYTYFEIGGMIVEDQQKGKERAQYGKETLKTLSKQLTEEFGKGFSVYNLERMRNFYNLYKSRISASAMRNSENPFKLSWTHYLKLLPTENSHFYVDLVFYNRLLKCFVLIDLKMGSLAHQDIGQMQMYVNYYDRIIKTDEENKTIGIILCKETNNTVVKFTLPEDNDRIFASKYKFYLPTKEALLKQLENI